MDNQNDGSPRAGVYPGAGRSQISRPHATQARCPINEDIEGGSLRRHIASALGQQVARLRHFRALSHAGPDDQPYRDLGRLPISRDHRRNRSAAFSSRSRARRSADLVFSPPISRTGHKVTEAISTNQARVDVLVAREDYFDFWFIPCYRVSDPPRSRATIMAPAQGQARILQRMGDSVERDGVEDMLHIVARESAACLKPGIAQHSTNWLVVYDNWQPVSAFDDQVATERFSRKLSGSDCSYPFGKVFVQRPRFIWEFSEDWPPIGHWISESWLARWWDAC